jgi:hypothetical protein
VHVGVTSGLDAIAAYDANQRTTTILVGDHTAQTIDGQLEIHGIADASFHASVQSIPNSEDASLEVLASPNDSDGATSNGVALVDLGGMVGWSAAVVRIDARGPDAGVTSDPGSSDSGVANGAAEDAMSDAANVAQPDAHVLDDAALGDEVAPVRTGETDPDAPPNADVDDGAAASDAGSASGCACETGRATTSASGLATLGLWLLVAFARTRRRSPTIHLS